MARITPPDTPSARTLTEAIKFYGSTYKLAKLVGVSQTCIWISLKRGRLSAELAKRLEVASGGRFPACQSRPDLWSASA